MTPPVLEIENLCVDYATPRGVFRAVDRPDYGSETNRQLVAAQDRAGTGDLRALLHSRPTWDVE